MKIFCRIGCAFGLVFVLGGAVANGQTGGAAPAAPAGAPGAGTTSGGNALSDLADQNRENAATTQPVAKPAPPTSRMSSFNRVTTSRKVPVPATSQSARLAGSGGVSAGAVAAARDGALHPFIPSGSNARATAANKSEIPAGSSWRQEPERPTRPPATATRSVTHSYFPGLRGGHYKNSNTAKVAHGGRTGIPGQAGLGMGARSASGGRPGQGSVSGRIPPAQASARPR